MTGEVSTIPCTVLSANVRNCAEFILSSLSLTPGSASLPVPQARGRGSFLLQCCSLIDDVDHLRESILIGVVSQLVFDQLDQSALMLFDRLPEDALMCVDFSRDVQERAPVEVVCPVRYGECFRTGCRSGRQGYPRY